MSRTLTKQPLCYGRTLSETALAERTCQINGHDGDETRSLHRCSGLQPAARPCRESRYYRRDTWLGNHGSKTIRLDGGVRGSAAQGTLRDTVEQDCCQGI